jgi:hypothetical protein
LRGFSFTRRQDRLPDANTKTIPASSRIQRETSDTIHQTDVLLSSTSASGIRTILSRVHNRRASSDPAFKDILDWCQDVQGSTQTWERADGPSLRSTSRLALWSLDRRSRTDSLDGSMAPNSLDSRRGGSHLENPFRPELV